MNGMGGIICVKGQVRMAQMGLLGGVDNRQEYGNGSDKVLSNLRIGP